MVEGLQSRPTILFVEDDEEVRESIQSRLEKAGYSVASAKNEVEAIQLITDDHPDISLILLDQSMHSDKALAAGRRIRMRAMLQNSVPVVVLPFEYEDPMEGLDMTMGEHDHKTYMTDTEQLTTLLERLLPV
jgi:CheY-like chemotaxis protein